MRQRLLERIDSHLDIRSIMDNQIGLNSLLNLFMTSE